MNEAGNMALALEMLGYQCWLPRHVVFESQPTPRVPVVPQVHPSTKPALPQINSVAISPVVDNNVKHENSTQPSPSAWVTLEKGVYVLAQGVLIADEHLPFAWFVPLPWRNDDGWCAWREAREETLLNTALTQLGAETQAELLHRYTQQNIVMDTLPEDNVPTCQWPLPNSVSKIYCFSGIAWQRLTGAGKDVRHVTMDWQGRQVQVICLPHPYSCLIDPLNKKRLWQELVNINL